MDLLFYSLVGPGQWWGGGEAMQRCPAVFQKLLQQLWGGGWGAAWEAQGGQIFENLMC